MEVFVPRARNGEMLVAVDSAQHEVLTIFERSVGIPLGGGIARNGGESIIEFSAKRGGNHNADEESRDDKIRTLALDAEKIEREDTGDNEVDEARARSGLENGNRHYQH